MQKRLLVAIVIPLSLAVWTLQARTGNSARMAFPRTVLWAWQRPERLGFIDTHKIALAVLAETITLAPLTFEPRNQPVSAPPDTDYIAVIRIQAPQGSDLSAASRSRVVAAISKLADHPHTRAIQIDFDATVSQRDYYRALLTELRARLPKGMPLSMTALVSWCEGDDWIADLPVDEAVAMYFRMGVDANNIRRAHMDVRKLREPLCRMSVGISLDEPWPRFDDEVRVYAFAPSAWTETEYRNVLERLAR